MVIFMFLSPLTSDNFVIGYMNVFLACGILIFIMSTVSVTVFMAYETYLEIISSNDKIEPM